MNHFGTKRGRTQIIVWLIWLVAVIGCMQPTDQARYQADNAVPLLGVVSHDKRNGPLFPWQPRYRWKKWALKKYRAWRGAYRRAKRAALLAQLALRGVVTMAQVVEWLTAHQVRYQMGVASVVRLVGNAQGEADHQPALSQSGRGGSRHGGLGVGAEPTDVSVALVSSG